VHCCYTAGAFEALKLRAACEFYFAAIRWPDPQRPAAEPDGKLLPGKVFKAGKFSLVQIASSLPDQKLISQLEAEGARRFERERTTVAAGDIGFGFYQGA
jgi:hypothetical protein